jgi:hypothetical protein
MAGLATPNLPTYYRDSAKRTERASQVTGASFTDGANNGGCAGPGIGIATGEANPKWNTLTSTPAGTPPIWGTSQYIGVTPGANGRIEVIEAGPDINDQVALVQATGTVAIDGIIASGAVNKTGAALATGDWAWGVVTV